VQSDARVRTGSGRGPGIKETGDLFSQVFSPDGNDLIGFSDRFIPLDVFEFERHPRDLFSLSTPNVLPAPPFSGIGLHLLPGEEDGVAEGLEEAEGVVDDDDPFDRGFSCVAGILLRLVEDQRHAPPEFLEGRGRFDEDGFPLVEEAPHVAFRDRESDAGDLGHTLVLSLPGYIKVTHSRENKCPPHADATGFLPGITHLKQQRTKKILDQIRRQIYAILWRAV